MTLLYKLIVLLLTIAFTALGLQAQNVGIGTNSPDASAKLHIDASNTGILIPRISLTNISTAAPVTAPATGLLVYNNNNSTTGGGGTGFYYWNGSQWQMLKTGGNTLDMAYDEGGPGAGRIISADAGTVQINGNGGLWVNASNPVQNSAIQANNTFGSMSSEVEMGYITTSSGNNLQGVRAVSNYAATPTGLYDGSYGIAGSTKHPTNGTIDLNATAASINKAIGVSGSISSQTSFTGSPSDMIASVVGITGSHNSGGGSVSGSRLYAGLFVGNGRTLGLWGENSTFIELIPRRQVYDYKTAVMGFYNAAANGGNNDADIGTGDSYLSIEANVTDATKKDVVLQARTTGNVGVGISTPTEKLHVSGGARVSSLAGTNNRLVQADATGVLSNIADGVNGQVLTTNGAGALTWQNTGSGGGGTKLQYNYNLTQGWNTNQCRLHIVTVGPINGISPAVGDAVIINTKPNTAHKSYFGIAHAWVQSPTQIGFYIRGFQYRANNNNNSRQVQITVLK